MKHHRPAAWRLAIALALAAPGMAAGQGAHDRHGGAGHAAPSEPGQAAFAAISEIVGILRANPDTDWSKVDAEGLRRHLIDMDNVTLRAAVEMQATAEGASFDATSDDPAVTGSIRRMVAAHAATMSGAEGMTMEAGEIPGGARLTVSGPAPEMIRGLGFIGIMTVGMHHQAHHLALARGESPHRH